MGDKSELYYISASHYPSREANLVHVLSQVAALSQAGQNVTLFISTAAGSNGKIKPDKLKDFGLELNSVKLRTLAYPFGRFRNISLGIYAFLHILFGSTGGIVSRNIFASYFLTLMGFHSIYECHSIEVGLRRKIQIYICESPNVRVVCISNGLKNELSLSLNLRKEFYVLPDAAFDRVSTMDKVVLTKVHVDLRQLFSNPSQPLILYVGQLYEGRGVEIVIGLSELMEDFNFLVIGGNERELLLYSINNSNNLKFLGHEPHSKIPYILRSADCLLMPYQKKVSVGYRGSDTARWMSPMKMFEFMSSGVPIIASNLPVLREILVHEGNCLLVQPDSVKAWQKSVKRIVEDQEFSKRLSANARQDFLLKHTWNKRAVAIINLIRG